MSHSLLAEVRGSSRAKDVNGHASACLLQRHPQWGRSRPSTGGSVTSLLFVCTLALSAALLFPQIAFAQSNPSSPAAPAAAQRADQQPNVPAGARQAEAAVEGAVRRFRIGVSGGVAIDPELI